MNEFEIKNLSYTVKDKTILDQLNLTIPQGSWTVISGPSGSGKSTFLKMLGHLISPSQGTIAYKGKDINHINPQSYRQDVSYCFQTPVLFGETVKDNLAFPYEIRGLDFDETHASNLLNTVGLHNFMEKKINDISGGEKQRVALIRNVMFMPKVLLLDEVTSALDTLSKQEVWKFVTKLHTEEKITVISVTHQVDEITNATHKIIIEEGKVVSDES
ncbi:ATP-binding cassette domain-containing protein [Erysipelothrix urinaevulpis]|uniref:ABC transporter ATP-binding protein n=1 Tax=Erysipelothrix urinaevulpis TaxID=2683717 RepID=UPI00135B8888|nr:ATP-binding cassette domain-containing protein [Erysipelothrix urinaevulpis]